jgi:hypothetical protein
LKSKEQRRTMQLHRENSHVLLLALSDSTFDRRELGALRLLRWRLDLGERRSVNDEVGDDEETNGLGI